METKVGTKRTRNWATIIYPRQNEGEETTCPDNWVEILSQLAVKAVASPLHDNDVTEDGEVKKAHRHVVIAFDGVKTQAQAKEIFEKIGGVGCEPISSLFSMTRYLTHLDNPEKAQYSTRTRPRGPLPSTTAWRQFGRTPSRTLRKSGQSRRGSCVTATATSICSPTARWSPSNGPIPTTLKGSASGR